MGYIQIVSLKSRVTIFVFQTQMGVASRNGRQSTLSLREGPRGVKMRLPQKTETRVRKDLQKLIQAEKQRAPNDKASGQKRPDFGQLPWGLSVDQQLLSRFLCGGWYFLVSF